MNTNNTHAYRGRTKRALFPRSITKIFFSIRGAFSGRADDGVLDDAEATAAAAAADKSKSINACNTKHVSYRRGQREDKEKKRMFLSDGAYVLSLAPAAALALLCNLWNFKWWPRADKFRGERERERCGKTCPLLQRRSSSAVKKEEKKKKDIELVSFFSLSQVADLMSEYYGMLLLKKRKNLRPKVGYGMGGIAIGR